MDSRIRNTQHGIPFRQRVDKADIVVFGVSDSNTRIFEMASKNLRIFVFFPKEELSVPKNEKLLKKRKGVLGIFKGYMILII